MRIRGETALITGAASGIGAEIAFLLAERGAAKVVLLDTDEVGLDATARRVAALGSQAASRRTDLSDLGDLADAYAEAAGHDYGICFNNAGIVVGPPGYPDVGAERIDLLVRVNLTAVLVGTKLAIAHLKDRGGGVIINTGSTAAVRPNHLEDAPYRVTKAAIHHLTGCCRELAETANIRVNAIHPGATETPILSKMSGGDGPSPWVADILRRIRLWTPREIAQAALDLVEDDSRIAENLVLPNEEVEPISASAN